MPPQESWKAGVGSHGPFPSGQRALWSSCVAAGAREHQLQHPGVRRVLCCSRGQGWEGVTSPGQEGPQGQPGSVPWGLHCLELLPIPGTWGWPSTPWHLQVTGLGMSQVPRWWHRLHLPRLRSAENHCIVKMRGQVKSPHLGDPHGAPELRVLLGTPRGRPAELIPSSAVPIPPTDPLHGELALGCCVGLQAQQLGHGRGIPWVCPLLSGSWRGAFYWGDKGFIRDLLREMHPIFPVLCSDLGSVTESWDRARLAQRGGHGWASVTLRCSTLALSSIITQIHLGCSAGSGAFEQLIPRSSSFSWVRSGNRSSFSADPPGFQAWL